MGWSVSSVRGPQFGETVPRPLGRTVGTDGALLWNPVQGRRGREAPNCFSCASLWSSFLLCFHGNRLLAITRGRGERLPWSSGGSESPLPPPSEPGQPPSTTSAAALCISRCLRHKFKMRTLTQQRPHWLLSPPGEYEVPCGPCWPPGSRLLHAPVGSFNRPAGSPWGLCTCCVLVQPG